MWRSTTLSIKILRVAFEKISYLDGRSTLCFLPLWALCRLACILEKIRSASLRPSLWCLCGLFGQQTEFINLFKLLFCFPSSFYPLSSPLPAPNELSRSSAFPPFALQPPPSLTPPSPRKSLDGLSLDKTHVVCPSACVLNKVAE